MKDNPGQAKKKKKRKRSFKPGLREKISNVQEDMHKLTKKLDLKLILL